MKDPNKTIQFKSTEAWFVYQSNIMQTCLAEETRLIDEYGTGNYANPYFIGFDQFVRAMLMKGMSKERLIAYIKSIPPPPPKDV